MPKNVLEIESLESLKHKQNHIHTEIYELANRLEKMGALTPFHKQVEEVKKLTCQLKDQLGYLEYLARQYDENLNFKDVRNVVITKGVALNDE